MSSKCHPCHPNDIHRVTIPLRTSTSSKCHPKCHPSRHNSIVYHNSIGISQSHCDKYVILDTLFWIHLATQFHCVDDIWMTRMYTMELLRDGCHFGWHGWNLDDIWMTRMTFGWHFGWHLDDSINNVKYFSYIVKYSLSM